VTHAYSLAGIAKTPARVVPLLGAVWICDCDSGQILRFDPVAGRVTKVVRLQEKGFLTGVDLGEVSTVWLIDPAAATITPLDATSGEPSGQPLGFGGGNVYDARIGFGSIWVAAGSQLYRFDLATGQRHAIAVPEGASAGGLAIDPEDGKVWVENCGCPDD
jgi:streptogramin lyase